MMEKHACSMSELSCIIGSLFIELDPPCAACGVDELVICGTTHSKNKAMIVVLGGGVFYFVGEPEDLKVVLNGRCPERRCQKRGEDYG